MGRKKKMERRGKSRRRCSQQLEDHFVVKGMGRKKKPRKKKERRRWRER